MLDQIRAGASLIGVMNLQEDQKHAIKAHLIFLLKNNPEHQAQAANRFVNGATNQIRLMGQSFDLKGLLYAMNNTPTTCGQFLFKAIEDAELNYTGDWHIYNVWELFLNVTWAAIPMENQASHNKDPSILPLLIADLNKQQILLLRQGNLIT
jgi:hypothetical protein